MQYSNHKQLFKKHHLDDAGISENKEASFDALHIRAVNAAHSLRKCEIELLEALEAVDAHKVFRRCGATSLFQYAVHILDLTESRAYDYITVMRAARENKKLKQAVHSGLSVTKARRITSHLAESNTDELIQWAKTKSLRDLDNTLARTFPNDYRAPERIRLQSPRLARLEANLDLDCEQMLRRVQDLESQRLRRPVSLGEALKILAKEYLEKRDPVKKAERWKARRNSKLKQSEAPSLSGTVLPAANSPKDHFDKHSSINCYNGLTNPVRNLVQARSKGPRATRRNPIPAAAKHKVYLRDGGKCQSQLINGAKCERARWLDIHHKQPRSMGGIDHPDNLITLCATHHRMEHDGPKP